MLLTLYHNNVCGDFLLRISNVTAQKMKFFIKDFFSRIWSHLLKKSLMDNFIFCPLCSLRVLGPCFSKISPWLFCSKVEVQPEKAAKRHIQNPVKHLQKQPPRVVPRKRCSENMQQLYWNHTSAWVFSCKFAAYFQNTFS